MSSLYPSYSIVIVFSVSVVCDSSVVFNLELGVANRPPAHTGRLPRVLRLALCFRELLEFPDFISAQSFG
jgi:hypothetical protein